ncbi:MAG: cupin domain-containing protein [Myxococcales bacterium]|nr:cupin domain-containing protein [Myxococcales bacterium]
MMRIDEPVRAGAHAPRDSRRLISALAALALACASTNAPEIQRAPDATNVKPVKLSREQIAGAVFEDFAPVVAAHERGDQTWTTHDVEAFVSSDRKFDAGIYRSEPVRAEIDQPYGVDEFMYFLEGGVILTSLDGSQLTIGPGDAVMIPKEWRGVWDTPEGYLKIYVIHSPQPLD